MVATSPIFVLHPANLLILWLGREDSTLRMAESKSAALPLGDAPIACGGAGAPRGAADHSGRNLPPQPRPKPSPLKLAQCHFLDPVRDAFGQNEACTRARRQDVFIEIAQVRARPDAEGGLFRVLVGEIGVFAKVRARIAERRLAQPHEARYIPALQRFLRCIEIDREIEKVGNERDIPAALARPARQQHVDALEDKDIRTVDGNIFIRHDVVGEVRINRRFDVALSGFDLPQETNERVLVIALRKTLLVHQAFTFEHRVRQKKTVGRDESDLRRVRPARQQSLQHARGRRLADRDGTGNADDIGHLAAVLGAEKALCCFEQALSRCHVKREQARQRQVDGDDFFDRYGIVDRLQLGEIVDAQRQRRVGAQPRPFGAGETPVRRKCRLPDIRRDLVHAPLARASTTTCCLLCMAGAAAAVLQLRHDLLEGNISSGEQDNKMIEHVGALLDESCAIAFDCGDHRLHRLFAEFLCGAAGAGFEEGLRVGLLCGGAGACRDDRGKLVQAEAAHWSAAHVARTCRPAPRIYCFACAIVWGPKWKPDAATTAAAWPSRIPATRWSSVPTPPDAITGTGTASEMARVRSMSNPLPVPSRSIEVKRISPAPRATTSFAYSTASMPVVLRPPWVKISHLSDATRLASIATTIHWLPNFSAPSLTILRSATAAELIEILSAPASNSWRISSIERTPPPTVSGMKQASAVRRTTSRIVLRFSWLAVMSRKQSSSAPAAS